MIFDIDIMDGVKVASAGFNIYVFSGWVQRKIVLHKFLVGRWEGTLKPADQPGTIYECCLVLVGHTDIENSGFLYYQHKDLANGHILISGLDKLDNYDHKHWFIWERVWRPEFVRAIHKCYGPNAVDLPVDQQFPPPSYKWECQITSIFFRPKMRVDVTRVDVTGNSRSFSGMFKKH